MSDLLLDSLLVESAEEGHRARGRLFFGELHLLVDSLVGPAPYFHRGLGRVRRRVVLEPDAARVLFPAAVGRVLAQVFLDVHELLPYDCAFRVILRKRGVLVLDQVFQLLGSQILPLAFQGFLLTLEQAVLLQSAINCEGVFDGREVAPSGQVVAPVLCDVGEVELEVVGLLRAVGGNLVAQVFQQFVPEKHKHGLDQGLLEDEERHFHNQRVYFDALKLRGEAENLVGFVRQSGRGLATLRQRFEERMVLALGGQDAESAAVAEEEEVGEHLHQLGQVFLVLVPALVPGRREGQRRVRTLEDLLQELLAHLLGRRRLSFLEFFFQFTVYVGALIVLLLEAGEGSLAVLRRLRDGHPVGHLRGLSVCKNLLAGTAHLLLPLICRRLGAHKRPRIQHHVDAVGRVRRERRRPRVDQLLLLLVLLAGSAHVPRDGVLRREVLLLSVLRLLLF